MFYYLYQITNKVNNKIYVGVHKTKDLNDGYMGSGKVIKRAIEKHGISNFTKVILETFENQESMYAREKEVVTEEFLNRKDIYNLRRGGTGGWDFINKTGLSRKHYNSESFRNKCKISGIKGGLKSKKLGVGIFNPDKKFDWTTPENSLKWKSISLKYRKLMNSPESIKKKKETFKRIKHQQGPKHNQYGTCWIYHELIGSKKCDKEKLPEYLDQGWFKKRIISHPMKSVANLLNLQIGFDS